jgi:hypothetical protein
MTQAYLEFLRKWRRDILEQWSEGGFQSESAETTQAANAQALGQANMLKKLSELDYEQFYESVIEDELGAEQERA